MQQQVSGMHLQWGQVTLTFDDPNFLKGFFRGRESYHRECVEQPRRATELVATDVLRLIALPDAQDSHYSFDTEGINNLEEYLGVFLGYLVTPLTNTLTEIEQEAAQNPSPVEIVPFVEITDLDCKHGYEEAQHPSFQNCKLRTDLALVDVIRDFLTGIAEEGRLTEQLLRRNTGFLIGILSKC